LPAKEEEREETRILKIGASEGLTRSLTGKTCLFVATTKVAAVNRKVGCGSGRRGKAKNCNVSVLTYICFFSRLSNQQIGEQGHREKKGMREGAALPFPGLGTGQNEFVRQKNNSKKLAIIFSKF
jgi:hypothetical protein